MCGIAGVFNFNAQALDRGVLKRMGDSIAHRGPDDHRYYFWSESNGNELYRHTIPEREDTPIVGFAHRRLAIVDISGGHQPMPNWDQSLWICYNGEIYNYLELREQLINKGYHFNTDCDTEVVLHLYEEYGADSVAMLNGIFAFAIWDSRHQELFLARDRFGVKPLYYTLHDNTLIFASEIKAILQVPSVPREPDLMTIAEHFTFQNHFGDRTFLKNIRLLPPATWLSCGRNGNITSEQYWHMTYSNDDLRDEQAIAEELQFYFRRAVTRQLMSEVPVGTFLSGGMDTGSISAAAVSAIPDMHTFTCGFALPSKADSLEQFFNESEESFALAKLLGTQHHEIILNSHHNFPALPLVAWALDEPRLGISYQNWYTSQLIREHVTVVLGGGAGDELFAGYHWRHSAAQEHTDLSDWNLHYYQQWIRFLDDEQKSHFFTDPINRELNQFSSYDSFLSVMQGANTEDPLSRALYFDAQTFLHGLLVVEDKLSMAHSIESRVPFLDNDFVDLVLRIPSALKLKNGESKYILKKAMRGLLPEATLTRRKQGFTPPDATWYRTELRDEVETLILGQRSLERGYFQPAMLRRLVEEHMQGQANHRFLLWSLMVFEWWNRLFIDGDALPATAPHYAH